MTQAPVPPPSAASPAPSGRDLGVLGLVMALTALPELLLLGADAGLWGSSLWRPLAYQYGAFWVGLLRDWQPNYAIQPGLMFVTYGVLHAGLGHLAGNLAGLAWLGRVALEQVGAGLMVVIYVMSALGGAAAFGILGDSHVPMVGASGAVFGLAGAWVIWDWQDQRDSGDPDALRTALRMTALLVGLNIAVWLLQGGQLAWETHLGGFLTGALLALFTQTRDG